MQCLWAKGKLCENMKETFTLTSEQQLSLSFAHSQCTDDAFSLCVCGCAIFLNYSDYLWQKSFRTKANNV